MDCTIPWCRDASFLGAVGSMGSFIYLLPSIAAHFKNSPNWGGVFILNLFGGWSIIGWIAALIWGVQAPRPPAVVITPPPIPSTSASSNKFDELAKLGELKGRGVITEDEFNAQKKRLLGS